MNHSSERPFHINFIRANVQEQARKQLRKGQGPVISDPEAASDLFEIYSANEWMNRERETQKPEMLFGNFWLEGELCILFADTNMGKSLLAVQLGDSITRGVPTGSLPFTAKPQPVLYIDFELTGKQFEQRYTDEKGTYQFDPEFYRGEFNQFSLLPTGYEHFDDYIIYALTRAIKRTGATVLMIDNITCLRNGTESTGQALSLMKQLKQLKTRHGLSILVLAHTPKRNPANPITGNDLQGSKLLLNFADSAFAMGLSHTRPNYRYLKQIKQRSTEQTYGAENVCMAIMHRQNSFLQFNFTGHDHEASHLRKLSQQQRDHEAAEVARYHQAGYSQRQIAARMQLSLTTVNKMVNWHRDTDMLRVNISNERASSSE